jgi:hypothetical protein
VSRSGSTLLQKSKIERRQKSRESKFLEQLYRCNALHRRCDGPWSFSWQTMRTLTSPYTECISSPGSSPGNFRSSPKRLLRQNRSNSDLLAFADQVCFAPMNRHREARMPLPFRAKTGSDKPYSITSSARATRDYRSAKSHLRRSQAYRPPIRYGSRVFPAALAIDLDQQSDFFEKRIWRLPF